MTTEAARPLIIIQVRMGSTRLPGKVLAEVEGRPVILGLVDDLAASPLDARIVVATTDTTTDDPLARRLVEHGVAVFRGSEDDVLNRYHTAAREAGCLPETPIVRITGDDIFPDWRVVQSGLLLMESFGRYIDAVFTAGDATFPYGIYVEVFRFSALEKAEAGARDAFDREHVTPFIRRGEKGIRLIEIATSAPFPELHLSVDTAEDLARARRIASGLAGDDNTPFSNEKLIATAQSLYNQETP